jgi:hypothetical protein
MASSTPSRSIEFDSSLPDTRLRSLSLSSSSQASHSVAREPLSRRSQTPKAKRKNVSIALPRARQSRNSTTAVVNNNHELDDSIDLSSPQNQLNQEQDAFERSSDDEKEVSYFDIIHLFC